MRSTFLAIGLAAATALALAPPAGADIFAVAPIVAPGHSDIDIGLIDASTGASLSLPAGVNTAAAENHPSISADGKHLAFQRHDFAAGTDRVIATDLATGQSRDLFDAFTAATSHPISPAISPNGNDVTTGTEGSGIFTWFVDDPGSFVHRDFFTGNELVDPTPTLFEQLFAFRRNVPLSGGRSRGVVYLDGGSIDNGPIALNASAFHLAHPAIGTPPGSGHTTILYDVHALDSSSNPLQGDIGFCVFFVHNGDPCGLGRGILPPLVSSARNETRPAFTPDGRYIGFIRDESNGHERLYVFDTETQTLIDSDGDDLGPITVPDTGSLSLYERPVLKVTSFPSLGTVGVSLGGVVPIGLFVRRVVGHHRLLGRRVPKLRTVGRIPLGKFKRGRHTIHWRPRVNGHRLRPGRYQFTVRALARSGKVRDLGRPRLLRVRTRATEKRTSGASTGTARRAATPHGV